MIVIDFGNVDKWKDSLGWTVGIKELGQLTKHLSRGAKYLRRFYYGEDYGPITTSAILTPWSDMVLNKAKMAGFEVVSKRVKYIPDSKYEGGFMAKCDLDLEMALDLLKDREKYDNLILFSGDGDFYCLLEYLKSVFDKAIYIFGARNHVGAELYDAHQKGTIKEIFYAEDFEYRLKYNLSRYPQVK